jgi:uncharacterized protein YndB with AHSA1/START domain
MVRRVRATQAEAFDAWVDPERLRAWFGPPGTTVVELEGELAVGGEYRFVLRDQAGDVTDLRWEFHEISPPERLVYGWRIGLGGALPSPLGVVTVVFREEGEGTEIELTHTGMVDPTYRDHTAAGWVACFEKLQTTLDHLV